MTLMSLARSLYDRAPLPAQDLFISAYGLYLRRLRYGREHDRQLALLLESQWWDAERIRTWQEDRATEVVSRARADVARYRGLPDVRRVTLEALRKLPITRKSDLRRPLGEVIARGHDPARLHSVHTGGTTGTPLHLVCTRSTLQKNYAFFSRLQRWAGANEHARTAVFAGRLLLPPGSPKKRYWRRNWSGNTLLFSSYQIGERTLPAYVMALDRFAPALIDAYPSSIEPIARFIVANRITSIRPRAVITSSETLFPEVRAVISAAFGCPVFDYYGGAEMAAFISQCEHGTHHVNPEFGIVEVLTDDRPARPGEVGEIVATGFLNPVMPLIRYATGDLAVPGDEACACGRAFPLIRTLLGRLDDVLITPEGNRVGRLDPIFKKISGVLETRIVQDALDHVRVEVVPGPEFGEVGRQVLRAELRARLGPSVAIDIVEVAGIPRTGRGKLQTVLRLIDAPGLPAAPDRAMSGVP